MNDKFVLPQSSQEMVDAHLQDHIRASEAVAKRRKQEVEAVLGPVPTFAEAQAAAKKLQDEIENKSNK